MRRATIYQRNSQDGDWLLLFTDTVRDKTHNETFDLMTDAIAKAREMGAILISMSTGRDGDLAPPIRIE